MTFKHIQNSQMNNVNSICFCHQLSMSATQPILTRIREEEEDQLSMAGRSDYHIIGVIWLLQPAMDYLSNIQLSPAIDTCKHCLKNSAFYTVHPHLTSVTT